MPTSTVEDVYAAAKADPVSSLILDALHAQDARTYHGEAGDLGALAIETAAKIEAHVRADERKRVADLIDENMETLAGFTGSDDAKTVQLIAFMLRLRSDGDPQE